MGSRSDIRTAVSADLRLLSRLFLAAALPFPAHALPLALRHLRKGQISLAFLAGLGIMTVAGIGWRILCARLRRGDRCPHCKSSDVRASHRRKPADRMAAKFGISAMRCNACGLRSYASSEELKFRGKTPARARVRPTTPTLAPMMTVKADRPSPPPPATPVTAPYLRPGAPAPSDQPLALRRRRKDRSRVIDGLAACVIGGATLIFPAVIVYRLKFAPRPEPRAATVVAAARPVAVPRPQTDYNLVVPEAKIVDQTGRRIIRGVLRNNAAVAYENVEIVFATQNRNLQSELITVTVPRVESKGAIAFETGPLPKDTLRFDLRPVSTR